MASREQRTVATVILVLVITEIVLHFCWKVIDSYFFTDFSVTTQIAILAVIALLIVLFWREELLFGVLGGGKKKKGGVRNGNRRDRGRGRR